MPPRTTSRKRDAAGANFSDSENPKAKSTRTTRGANKNVKKYLDLEAVEDNGSDDGNDGSDVDGLFCASDEEGDDVDDCDVPLPTLTKKAVTFKPGTPSIIPPVADEPAVNLNDIFGEADDDAASTADPSPGDGSDNKPVEDSSNQSEDSVDPAQAVPPKENETEASGDAQSASGQKDKKVAESVQTKLGAAFVATVPEVKPEDAIEPRVSFTPAVLKRFKTMFNFVNEDESTYGLRLEPSNLEWSSSRVKGSFLRVKGEVTPIRLWVIGDINWNGLLPGDDGKFPPRAKMGVTPLRSGDLMRIRQLVKNYSKSKKELEINNISSISAHKDMAVRTRGSDAAEAKPFAHIYDGRVIFTTDKSDMRTVSANTLVRGDVVLMEFTVSRYWDLSENGRVKDWDSSRVYFQLEAVTLLVNAEDPAAIVVNAPKPKKKIVI